MRNTLLKSFIVLSLTTSIYAKAATIIKSINIQYSRLLFPVDRQGFEIPQFVVGGNVDYTGDLPIFVTLTIAGQSYTQPTDKLGQFSFFAYAAGAGSYQLDAWVPSIGAAPKTDSVKVA